MWGCQGDLFPSDPSWGEVPQGAWERGKALGMLECDGKGRSAGSEGAERGWAALGVSMGRSLSLDTPRLLPGVPSRESLSLPASPKPLEQPSGINQGIQHRGCFSVSTLEFSICIYLLYLGVVHRTFSPYTDPRKDPLRKQGFLGSGKAGWAQEVPECDSELWRDPRVPSAGAVAWIKSQNLRLQRASSSSTCG